MPIRGLLGIVSFISVYSLVSNPLILSISRFRGGDRVVGL